MRAATKAAAHPASAGFFDLNDRTDTTIEAPMTNTRETAPSEMATAYDPHAVNSTSAMP